MGRLVGYMANRSDRLRDALHQERDAIGLPPANEPAGWGIGFYQGSEVLHKKRPVLEGTTFDWDQIVKGVRSECALIHVRHATVGDFRVENTHPFRMGSWLFAHSGTIERFAVLRDRLLEGMPDFIRRGIRGDTDSEHFFHVLLSFLHDAGQFDRPDADDRAVITALRSAVRLVDQLGQEIGIAPPTLNLLLTNGRQMYGLRRGGPLAYVERQSIEEPLTGGADARAPTPVRYVAIVSHGPELPSGYAPLAEGSVCAIDPDLRATVHPA